MDTWVWIVIAVGAVIVVGLLLLGAVRARERRLEAKRGEAWELRQQAEAKAQRAEHRASVADELAEGARAERREAEVAARRADEVDPDADD
jgi:flagellar biosynthesis/type III secretory pathway M-ring protein FliF/YscJ